MKNLLNLSPKIGILPPTCFIFLHVTFLVNLVCSPQVWVQLLPIFFHPYRKIFLNSVLPHIFSTTEYLCDYTCQKLCDLDPHSQCRVIVFFFALQLIRLLFLFAIPIFKQNTKALCKTHHHQERTEQIFILQGHMPLGERITIGNGFCKTWYFWKPARGEDPKCLTHSCFSDFVLREKGFNITV